LQAELQKQTDYFHEETGIMQHQLEILRTENVKMKVYHYVEGTT